LALGASLTTLDEGYTTFDITANTIYFWNGSAWVTPTGGGSAVWGSITGTVTDQTDLTAYLAANYYPLSSNPAGYLTLATLPPVTGTLVALPFTTDHLSSTNNQYVVGDVVYYIGNVYRCIANNDSLQPNLSPLYWTNLGAGFPLVQQPSDWNSTSGNNQILNKPSIPAAQVNSDWNAISGLAEILNKPTIPTVGTWGALNYPTWVSGTPFVKMTAAGTFSLDTTSYQPLLTNPVTGTGTATQVAFWDTGSSISSDVDLYWDNINKRLGIGTTAPKVRLHIGNAGGLMGFPFEEAIVEKTGDTKFGVYTSTGGFSPAIGVGITLGYTGVTANSTYYPGFEFQHKGDAVDADNYVRYNFIQRDLSGNVVGGSQNLLNIYASGRITLNPVVAGTFTPPVPQFLVGLNTSIHVVDIESVLSTRISSLGGGGTQMVVADNDGVLGAQTIPTGSSVGFEMNFLLMGA
jgi:hypothetical protein